MKRAWSRKNLWNALPWPLQMAAGRLLGTVPLPWLLGARFRQWYRFLGEAQWWDAERVRAYQVAQLRTVLTLAYEKTSYYRRLFDAVGFQPGDLRDISDLAALPTIDKTIIQEHLEEMVIGSPNRSDVDYVTTGGTSGTPLRFYIGRNRSAFEYAHLARSWERAGYCLKSSFAVFRGRVVPEDRNGLRHAYDPLLRHHFYSNFHMTDDNMRRYLAHVASIGPCFLHVYPSSVHSLANCIARHGISRPRNIRGIIAESEIVYPHQRQLAEAVFGCRYFSCYGHTEKLLLGAECEYSTDYHIWPTYGVFELLDADGRTVSTPGTVGEMVGTGFANTVMPFIRYRTGDMAMFVGTSCSRCGRQHLLVRDVRGHRTQEFLLTSDGSEVSWTALNMHDDTFDRVRQFQFHQSAKGKAVLKVVPSTGFCEADAQRIQGMLNRKLEGRVKLEIRLVESIPLTRAGKAVYVDRQIPIVDDRG